MLAAGEFRPGRLLSSDYQVSAEETGGRVRLVEAGGTGIPGGDIRAVTSVQRETARAGESRDARKYAKLDSAIFDIRYGNEILWRKIRRTT
jgi:hypothetical protein